MVENAPLYQLLPGKPPIDFGLRKLGEATVDHWIADRTRQFDSSGIRRVFELAASLKDPIDLSIGQPDFDVPAPIKESMVQAIESGKNSYAMSSGVPELRQKLKDKYVQPYGHEDRELFVASGTSGGLTLAMMSLVNPGDEVVIFDPYFLMYEPLVRLAAGTPVVVDTDENFQINIDTFTAALTDKTKVVLINSPSNPTGVCLEEEVIKQIALICKEKKIALISDEIYQEFSFDKKIVSAAKYNEDTIVIDGFSKSHAMTGWRLGFVHGPKAIMETMIKLQQYSFVCAPKPVQYAGLAAMDMDISSYVEAYKKKRDIVYDGLKDHYELIRPEGAFYAYPRLPWGTGESFVKAAVENNLLVIPGQIFSRHDTHFRISFAASDQTLERGIEVLQKLAKQPVSV